jgi:hypothetical protein
MATSKGKGAHQVSPSDFEYAEKSETSFDFDYSSFEESTHVLDGLLRQSGSRHQFFDSFADSWSD